MFENIFDLSILQELSDWRILIYIILGGGLLTVFKILNGICAGYKIDSELTEKDNKAIAVSLAGFLVSLCLIIHGVLVTPHTSLLHWSFVLRSAHLKLYL